MKINYNKAFGQDMKSRRKWFILSYMYLYVCSKYFYTFQVLYSSMVHILSKIAKTSINLTISFNTMLRKTCNIKMHE